MFRNASRPGNQLISRPISIGFLGIIALLLSVGQVVAQGGVDKWLRYDVNINIQQNSGITVEEIQEVVLNQGVTTFRNVIAADKADDITNITVLQNPRGNSRTFQQADTQAEYTFQVVSEQDRKIIQLYFPPNNAPSTTFVFRYFVVGGLRLYEGGDRFDWRPFGPDVGAAIDSSTTVVNLPAQFADNQVARSHTGVGGVNNYFTDGQRVSFVATNVPAGGDLEISVTFPHGVVQGNPPRWQNEVDTLELWSPILGWGSLLVGFLMLVVCLAAVLGWWYFRIRLSPAAIGKVPKYLKSPPSELSPAVAGALIDGKVNPRHLMATMLDMAYHRVLNVAKVRKDPESLLPDEDEAEEPVFEIYGLDQSKAERAYEQTLYGKIFGYAGAKKRQLSAVRQILYLSVPELKKEVEFEIAKRDYFAENISGVRRQYLAFGGAGILMSLVLALLAGVLLSRFTYLAACPFLGITVGAVGLMVVAFAIPRKTEIGAKEAARWEAFKRYLTAMGVKEAAKVRMRFGQYLPYAVAFGIEKQFVEKFAAAKTPAPKWWGKPEEKLPDIGHDQAHAWVSSGYLSDGEPPQQRQSQKRAGKGVIRRLGEPADENQGSYLSQIEPEFLTFLDTALEVFARPPDLEEEPDLGLEAINRQQTPEDRG